MMTELSFIETWKRRWKPRLETGKNRHWKKNHGWIPSFLSQNILERDKNRVFDFSRQNESVSLKLEGMAEKTNDDANNLEAEYEVSSDWSLSWPGSDWLISW